MKIIAALVSLILLTCCGCNDRVRREAAEMTGGDPESGREAIRHYGCTSCHTIPGIPGANALVGPSLERIANRSFIAGVMKNTPDNMIRWIQHPPEVDGKTAMPDVHASEKDARDIAAYLYTCR
jgi:cytochrome c